MRKKVYVIILIVVCMILSLVPAMVYAEDAATATEVTVGTTGTYDSLKTVFDDTTLSGDVVVTLVSDVKESTSGVRLIVPERFSSLTIQSAEGTSYALTLNHPNSDKFYNAIYANGKNLTLKAVVKASYGNASLYGGGYCADVSGNPVITVDAAFTGTIYGGGFNATLTGSPDIVLSEKVSNLSVHGGGYALVDSRYNTDPSHAEAHVNGDISVSLAQGGSIRTLYGGGYAETYNTNDVTSESALYTVAANVTGSITLDIQGDIDTVYGGGYAGQDKSSTNIRYYTATADVSQNVSITFGEKAYSPSGIHLYGGGYAGANLEDPSCSAQANVGGKITVSVLGDADASDNNDTNHAFVRFFGGGFACGNRSVANVGSTEISTPRACFESSIGLVGGGYATSGGTANVIGQSSVRIFSMPHQKSSYENVNNLIGGGYAEAGVLDSGSSTANVGSTRVVIEAGVYVGDASGPHRVVLGGGYATRQMSASEQNYTRLSPATANVLGNTVVEIVGTTALPTRISVPTFGGGYAACSGDVADVLGNASVSISGVVKFFGTIYGGGYSRAQNSTYAEAITTSACVGKNSSITISGPANITQPVFGGGYAATSASVARIGKDVTVRLAGSVSEAIVVNASVYAGGNTPDANAQTVIGNTAMFLSNVKGADTIWLKGSGSKGSVGGTKSLTLSGVNSAGLLYDYTSVALDPNASLSLTPGGNNKSFYSIGDFTLPATSTLTLGSIASIVGNFVGGGTIELPANTTFSVSNYASETTTVRINGTLTEGTSYIYAKDGSVGNFVFEGDPDYSFDQTTDDKGNLVWSLIQGTAPSITTEQLSDGVKDTDYTFTLSAEGTDPIVWSVTDGALPDGLSLDAHTGVISGIPTQNGTFTFTVTARNGVAPDASKQFTIFIALPPTITTDALSNGVIGSDYRVALEATGDDAIVWSVTDGALPDGLSLDAHTGVISGIPTQNGTFTFTVTARNGVAPDASKQFTIFIALPPTITTDALSNGVIGSDYRVALEATGDDAIVWSVTDGALPNGLSLDASTGVIGGIPTQSGTFTFTVTARNGVAPDASKQFTIFIALPPTITTDALSDGVIGSDYRAALEATGDDAIVWSVTDGALPNGLSLDASTGVIGGIPTQNGTFTFTVTARNGVAPDASKQFTIFIALPPTITTDALSNGVIGSNYRAALEATGDDAIVWSVTDGALPNGLSLDATTGVIGGIPTQSGTFTFTVTAGNGVAPDASQRLTIKIDPIKIISGADSSWSPKSEEGLVVKTNTYHESMDVTIDGVKVSAEYYEVTEKNEIIVTSEYLKTLEKGTHTLRISYADSSYAETSFTIDGFSLSSGAIAGICIGILLLLILLFILAYILYVRRKEKEESQQ